MEREDWVFIGVFGGAALAVCLLMWRGCVVPAHAQHVPGQRLHFEPRPYNENYPPAIQRAACGPTPAQLAQLDAGFKATAPQAVVKEVPAVVMQTPTPEQVQTVETLEPSCLCPPGSAHGATVVNRYLLRGREHGLVDRVPMGTQVTSAPCDCPVVPR